MVFAFDSSSVNRIYRHSDRERVLDAIDSAGVARVLALNVYEVCATPHLERRRDLLVFLDRLAKGKRPLHLPIVILKKFALAHRRGAPRVDISACEPVFWVALKNPDRINEQLSTRFLAWGRTDNDFLNDAHRNARSQITALCQQGLPLPASLQEFDEQWWTDDVITAIMAPLYKQVTRCSLTPTAWRDLSASYPEWAIYARALGRSVYDRVIQRSGHGKKRKAGFVDIAYAVYLRTCDIFVTDDRNQRELLCWANLKNPNRSQIIGCDDFLRVLRLNYCSYWRDH